MALCARRMLRQPIGFAAFAALALPAPAVAAPVWLDDELVVPGETPPELAALVAADLDRFAHVVDAAIAEGVLVSVGQLAWHGDRRVLRAHGAAPADPFRAHAPRVAGPGIGDLAHQSLGADQGLALSMTQRFASATRFTTDLALRHAAGPLDVDADLTRQQPLVAGAAPQLDYKGQALVAVLPALQLGVAGSGGDRTPAVGPTLRWRLIDGRAVLSSDAAYGVAPAAVEPDRLHVKLDLKISL